jgi:hypothetical protein
VIAREVFVVGRQLVPADGVFPDWHEEAGSSQRAGIELK